MAKGKKGKQIEKPAKAARPAPKEESSDPQEDNGDIFSATFKQRLDQFATLNQEVLTIKAQVEGSDTNAEIAQRRGKVSSKIETASAAILKEELNSLEKWIEDQQAQLAEEIRKIIKARDDIEATLRSTGAFSEEEIASKVATVQARADERQQVHDDYSALLAKSQQIYS